MSIIYAVKAFSQVVPDGNNIYYTPPSLDVQLASAEKYFVALRAQGVAGAPNVTVSQETSNDGVNWQAGVLANPIPATALANGVVTVAYGGDLNPLTIRGRQLRLGVKLSVAVSMAYVELWVTGRTLS